MPASVRGDAGAAGGHSSAVVGNLSSSRPSKGAVTAASSKAVPEPGLARRLIAHLGRALHTDEANFVRKVSSSYNRCRQLGHISRWDFNEMGLRLGGYGWDTLQIWPAFPADEHEFWLYVARAARGFGVAIPEFMAPISDFERVEKRWPNGNETGTSRNGPGRWEVRGSIKSRRGRWFAANGFAYYDRGKRRAASMAAPGAGRLRIHQAHAIEATERGQYGGPDSLATEAALLWQLIANQFYYGNTSHLRYRDVNMATALGRVLRTPMLESRIVNREGHVLTRPAEPLRWAVEPAANEDEDYSVRLVQADGQPPPAIRCVMEGDPTLYLAESAIFTGPQPQDEILNAAAENRIPAPAIEQASGVAFLKSLGADLPERLREKVRTLKYQPSIGRELEPIYPGSTAEDCVLNVMAEAPNGHQLTWTGQTWLKANSAASGRGKRKSQDIILYDAAPLETVPILLEPLNPEACEFSVGAFPSRDQKIPRAFHWLA